MSDQAAVQKLSWIGMCACALGVAVFVALFAAMGAYLFGGLTQFNVAAQIGVADITGPLSFAERAVGLFFWLMSPAIGLWFCCVAFALFRGFRMQGVFTEYTALRLRRIGWLVCALAPVNILSGAAGTAALSCLRTCGNGIVGDGRLSVSLEDTDIYALVIGLLILAVGHIFVEAVRLSEENRSFV